MNVSDRNIQIAVRIKPFSSLLTTNMKWDNYKILADDKNIFQFDYVLDPYSTQQTVFDKIGFKIISNVLDGYNGCIFAYGQTGSGKTYTMTGNNHQQGLIQKCLKTLWNCVKQSQFSQIKLSYFQIYNETIKDLLSQRQNLPIRQHTKNGFYIQNLSQHTIYAYQQFQQLINQGLLARSVKETKMNSVSSRSHSILQIKISYKSKDTVSGLNITRNAKMSFIDLAGSQKQKQTGVEGDRLKQASNINKSLSNLSLVIAKLSQNSQQKKGIQIHIPYRNSVLTKILKNNLTGKSKILIVCMISVQNKYFQQTLSTLRFAQTAKNIKLKVKKNQQQIDGERQRINTELSELRVSYDQLKQKYQQKILQNDSLKLQNAKLMDQLQQKDQALNQIQLNYACTQIQNHKMVQKMYSQQMLLTQNYGQQQNNFHMNTFSDSNIINSSFSQAFKSQPKNCFTINQVEQKQEEDVSIIKQNYNKLVQKLQQNNKKLEIRNQFLKFSNQILQEENSQLLKKIVFMKQDQSLMQRYMNFVGQYMKNCNFDHAQSLFLKTCIQHVKAYQNQKDLAIQQKKIQKSKFNQIIQKVKLLLENYISMNNTIPNIQTMTLNSFQPTNKDRSNFFVKSQQIQENQNSIMIKKDKQGCQYFSNQKICQKQNKNKPKNLSIFNMSQNPNQFKGSLLSQGYLQAQFKGSILSQNLLSQKGHSVNTPVSNFNNNQIQILKKQIEKLKIQNKQNCEQLQRYRIKLIQKQSQCQQIECQLSQQLNKNNKTIRELSQQISLLKNYLNEQTRNYEMLEHQSKLKIKQLEIGLKNSKIKNTQINQSKNTEIQNYQKQKITFMTTIQTLKQHNEQIQRQNAILNSQNRILNQKYHQIKNKLFTNNQFNKISSKQSNFVVKNSVQKLISQQNSLISNQEYECEQIIQNKNLQKIHKSAYYYYKKCYTLTQLVQKLQNQNQFITNQNLNLKFDLKQYLILKDKILGRQKQQKKIPNSQQKNYILTQNQNLKKKLYQYQSYARALQIKLKQRQQLQFQQRQKNNHQSINYYQISQSDNKEKNIKKISQYQNSFNSTSKIHNQDLDSPTLSSESTVKNWTYKSSQNLNTLEKMRNLEQKNEQIFEIKQIINEQKSLSNSLLSPNIYTNQNIHNSNFISDKNTELSNQNSSDAQQSKQKFFLKLNNKSLSTNKQLTPKNINKLSLKFNFKK